MPHNVLCFQRRLMLYSPHSPDTDSSLDQSNVSLFTFLPDDTESHLQQRAAKKQGRGRKNVAGWPKSVSRSHILIGQTPESPLTASLPLSTYSNRLTTNSWFYDPGTSIAGGEGRAGREGEAAILAAARIESRQEGGGSRKKYEKYWRNQTLRRDTEFLTVLAARCEEHDGGWGLIARGIIPETSRKG